MTSSAKLALFAFLYSIRSKSSNLSRKLRAFILRGLFLLPHIRRKLKKIWSWYSQPRSSDGKKTMGNAGNLAPASAGMSQNPEEYGIIYASRVSQPSSVYTTSTPGGPEESIPLEQSRGPSFATTPPSPNSPRYLNYLLLAGSTAGSSQAETTPGIMSDPPSTLWAHPRATSSKVTDASSLRYSTWSIGSEESIRGISFVTAPPLPNAPRYPALPLPTGNTAGSSQAETTPGIMSGPPITWAHPRATSSKFTGAFPRSRPRTPSPSRSRSGSTDSQVMSSASQPRPSSLPRQTQGLPTQPVPKYPPGQMLGPNASAIQPVSDKVSLRKMNPDEVSRYKKRGDVPREDSGFWLRAMDLDLSRLLQCKQGSDNWVPVTHRDSGEWIPVTHPGGALYFYHETFRAFTDVYMYDPGLRAQVHQYIDQLETQLAELNPNWVPRMNRYDLVLDIIETKDKRKIPQYYYVDHDKRTLFWLDDHDLSNVLYEVPGVQEPDHIRHRLEAFYWVHWSLYPRGYPGRDFPADACDELLGVLLSNSIDSLTCNVSTAPYSVADMKKMHDFMKDAKDLGPENIHAISSVARLLSICVQWKFVHFHGQKISRQDRSKSIYMGDGHRRTKSFQVLSLFLFSHPEVHLRELKKVWMDELIYDEAWRDFVVMLQSEWEEFILNLTVILAANVSFLSIPGVIPDERDAWAKPSTAQVASCMSLVFSIGGIISGLLLIRSTHTLAGKDTGTAWKYLDSKKKRYFYLEPLATIYSLPYGLLMWSVCTFFIALLLITFSKTREEIRVPLGVTVGLVGLFIIWCIVILWDQGDEDSECLLIED